MYEQACPFVQGCQEIATSLNICVFGSALPSIRLCSSLMASNLFTDSSAADVVHTEVDGRQEAVAAGMFVEVTGLKRQVHLNGSFGKLEKFHAESGRWQVTLDGRTVLVHTSNLRLNRWHLMTAGAGRHPPNVDDYPVTHLLAPGAGSSFHAGQQVQLVGLLEQDEHESSVGTVIKWDRCLCGWHVQLLPSLEVVVVRTSNLSSFEKHDHSIPKAAVEDATVRGRVTSVEAKEMTTRPVIEKFEAGSTVHVTGMQNQLDGQAGKLVEFDSALGKWQSTSRTEEKEPCGSSRPTFQIGTFPGLGSTSMSFLTNHWWSLSSRAWWTGKWFVQCFLTSSGSSVKIFFAALYVVRSLI